MKHRKFELKDLTFASLIAALYVLLTFFANTLGLASGVPPRRTRKWCPCARTASIIRL